MTTPNQCPCCTQTGRLKWKSVVGASDEFLLCEECFVTWDPGDPIEVSMALPLEARKDSLGREIYWEMMRDLENGPAKASVAPPGAR